MKILHMVNEVRSIGNGITHVAVDLATEQAKAGENVVVASGGGEYEQFLRSQGILLARIRMKTRHPMAALHALRQVRKVIREFRPDVIHSHTILATVLARLATVSVLRKVLVVATIHNEYQRGVGLMIWSSHHSVGVSAAVSAAVRARGVPHKRVSTIINGSWGSERLRAPVVAEVLATPAIVFCGGISHRKGIDVLINAFGLIAGEFENAELFMVGNVDWPLAVELQRTSPYASRMKFVGFLSDPRAFMAGASVFVLPSRNEPLGLVLLEAMALGVPVIGSNVGGIPELLEEGRSGMLVSPDNPEELAAALRRVLRDAQYAADIRQRGAARARLFTSRGMADSYRDLYSELLARAVR